MNSKRVYFQDGGWIELSLDVPIMSLSREDRAFVKRLLDLLDREPVPATPNTVG